MKKSYLAVAIVLLVLILDQALKIWVKTTFNCGEERALLGLSWAKLNFVENPGMAFGWKFGGEYGKLALSLFRTVAIGFLIYYIYKLVQRKVSNGLISSFSLILAGAIGNMIDSAFYGLIFSKTCVNSHNFGEGELAKLFPEGEGYGGFLHGNVVDMLFFPLLKNANGEVMFFQPVFNIADSAITLGVISILLFQRSYFNSTDEKTTPENNAQTIENQSVTPEGLVEMTENRVNTEGVLGEELNDSTPKDTNN